MNLIVDGVPRGQLIACCTVNWLLQMQWEGKRGGRQPYLRQRASLNSPLWRAKPCSAIGRVDSQLEAPFSDDQKNRGNYLITRSV